MTYEIFKKELHCNVQKMETAQDKMICLLEQHMVCSEPAAVRIMNIISRGMYGRETTLVREDMICALWNRGREEYIQYWMVHALYERYLREGWQGILPEISAALSDTEENILWPGENPNYAVYRNHMIVRPVNLERHRWELDNAVCRRIGDVALVLYLLIGKRQTGGGLAVQLTKSMALPWKMTEERLITEAMMNCCLKMPPRLFLGSDRRKFFPYHQGILLPEEEGRQTRINLKDRREGRDGYLLTTAGRVNGAVAFFYPGVREMLAEKIDGDYYVVFPSVHEAMIHPVNSIPVREIRASVQHINAVYGESGMLSDRVFYYHRNRRLLQLM